MQKWNGETAAHLLNRGAFGSTAGEIEAARKKGLAAMVHELVDVKTDAANVPPPAWAHPRNIPFAPNEWKSKQRRIGAKIFRKKRAKFT